MVPISVSVLKLVRQAICLVGKLVEQSVARFARSYVLDNLLAHRHPPIRVTRRLFVVHLASLFSNRYEYAWRSMSVNAQPSLREGIFV
jgi:hypothetical protein